MTLGTGRPTSVHRVWRKSTSCSEVGQREAAVHKLSRVQGEPSVDERARAGHEPRAGRFPCVHVRATAPEGSDADLHPQRGAACGRRGGRTAGGLENGEGAVAQNAAELHAKLEALKGMDSTCECFAPLVYRARLKICKFKLIKKI